MADVPCALVVDIGSSSARVTVVALAAAGSPRACRGLLAARVRWGSVAGFKLTDAVAVADGATACLVAVLDAVGLGRVAGATPHLTGSGDAPPVEMTGRWPSGAGSIALECVAMTTFVTAFVPIARDGAAVGPMLMYNAGGDAVEDGVAAFRRRLSEHGSSPSQAWDECGAPCHASYLGPQAVAAAARPRDSGFDRCSSLCSLGAFVAARWLGRHPASLACSVSEAAWSGLWDWRRQRWHRASLAACGLRGPGDESASHGACGHEAGGELAAVSRPCPALPRVELGAWQQPGSPAAPSLAAPPRCEALQSCPFLVSVGDGAAAALGSGCGLPPGAAAAAALSVTVGTSAAVRLAVSRDELSGGAALSAAGVWGYQLGGRAMLLGGALTDGASVLSWADALLAPSAARHAPEAAAATADTSEEAAEGPAGSLEAQLALLALPDGSALQGSAAKRPCGEGGLHSPAGGAGSSALGTARPIAPLAAEAVSPIVALPFLSGERATGWAGDRRCALVGLSRASTGSDVRAALVLGVSFRLAAVAMRLLSVCGAASSLPAVGSGGALEGEGSVWPAAVAACLGTALLLPDREGDCKRDVGGAPRDTAPRDAAPKGCAQAAAAGSAPASGAVLLRLERTSLGALLMGAEAAAEAGQGGVSPALMRALPLLREAAAAVLASPGRVALPPPAGSDAAALLQRAGRRHDRVYAALAEQE